jgi:hypothetical protein
MSKVWKNTPENFWSKTRHSESGCLEWAAQTTDHGYGRVSWHGKKRLAHRVAMYLYGGISDLDADTCVLHKCDNRLCCNPQHLFLGTKQDNTRDAVAKGRQFIPDNRGARSGNAKLSDAQAEEIRKCYAEGNVSQLKIASAYGVNQMSISKIVRGVSYSA